MSADPAPGRAQAAKLLSCFKSCWRGSFDMKDPQGFLEGAGQSPASYMGFAVVALSLVPRARHLGVPRCAVPQVYSRLLGSFLN